MFDSSFDSPFNSHTPFSSSRTALARRRRRHHRRTCSWDMYESPYPVSSLEDIHHTQVMTAPPFPLSRHTYERHTHYPIPSPSTTDLPSRVSALNRHEATLSMYLAHLAAVVEPLKSANVDEMSELDLRDILQEGQGLQHGMRNFEDQFAEIWELFEQVIGQRKEVVQRLLGGREEKWGKRKKGYRTRRIEADKGVATRLEQSPRNAG